MIIPNILLLLCLLLVVVSFYFAPRRVDADGFFSGQIAGKAPGLWMLTLSQVTTWIFARSLLNAAILGYFYGVAGVLAYTAYYGSFLTGGYIVGHLRKQGAWSLQHWLQSHFGAIGAHSYNIIVALRLLSEVFANLIVVGMIFAAILPDIAQIGPHMGLLAMLLTALLALIYSAWGGLGASLRTDVVQMLFFLVVFVAAFAVLLSSGSFSFVETFRASGVHEEGARPGWVLLFVALLQVFSYPAHDPVMMDRGFVSDDITTKRSFYLAFLIASLCIFFFGLIGVHAGLQGVAYDNSLLGSWQQLFSPLLFVLLMAALLVSALSTLDSTFASSARLVVEELHIGGRDLISGRVAMILFAIGGLLLTLMDNKTLFDAVAVTGTASMFLTPVLIVGLVLRRPIALWAYLVAFAAAIFGAVAYFFRGSELVNQIFGGGHKYDQLLHICIAVLIVGFAAVLLGVQRKGQD